MDGGCVGTRPEGTVLLQGEEKGRGENGRVYDCDEGAISIWPEWIISR